MNIHLADPAAAGKRVLPRRGYAPPVTPDPALAAIAADLELTDRFGDGVRAEVEALRRRPGLDDPSLVDLESIPFVTIDHASSLDLDQAVHVARHGDGWRVDYALADAAHFVRPGTALFEEALARGASFYLPGWMIPMLPRELCQDLVSLNPGVRRRAMVMRMDLGPDGRSRGTRVVRARIRSRAKLSFDRVQSFYDDPAGQPFEDRAVAASLTELARVGEARRGLAEERDVVRYRRSEVDVRAVPGPGPTGFVAVSGLRNDAERHNEQISLLCNVEGARLFATEGRGGGDAQPIFRVHPPPAEDRVEELEALVAALAREHGLDSGWLWRRGSGRSLAEYLDALPRQGAPGRVARAVHRQALLINGRSSYSAQGGAHFGVGAEVYGRFSAPMREIVGVFLHKETWELLRLEAPRPDEADEALRERVIQSANRSRQVQKRLDDRANRLVIDHLFQRDLAAGGPPRRATVVGLDRRKVHLTLDEPPIDVKAYLHYLSEERGERVLAADDRVRLRTEGGEVLLRVGDAVTVAVRTRDDARDRWALSVERGATGESDL